MKLKKTALLAAGTALAAGVLTPSAAMAAEPVVSLAVAHAETPTPQLPDAEPYATYYQKVKCQIVNYQAGTVVGTVEATGSGNTIDKARAAARQNAHAYLINGQEYMRHCTYSSARRDSGGGRF